MKKLLAIILVVVFLASLIPMNITSALATEPINGIKHPPAGTFPIGLGDDIPGIDGSSFMEAATADEIVPMLTPHSPWTVAVSDDYNNTFYDIDFQQVLSGVYCNIWIGLTPDEWWNTSHTVMYKDEWVTNGPGFADDVFYFAYPWSWRGGTFWGAPRLLSGYRDYIYGAQLEQLRDEFDNNIWGKDTSFFGMYADRPGPLNDSKIQILIFNIRDGLFWDPVTAPYFIEGYFWSYISNLYNANIIHIDTYQWFRRQGPTPTGGEPAKRVDTYPTSSLYPYEYEGTFAHEFQHLIHRDIDADEMSWPNEGCSELAQIICGYGFPASHIANYIYAYRTTSLVIWQGSLANYGAVALWTYYMYEHYGGQPFIYALVHEQLNGIAGYNAVLQRWGYKSFDAIFEDWAIANYLDDTSFSKGIYGYYGLDIPSANTQGWSIPYVIHHGGASPGGQYTPGPSWPSYPGGVRLGMALPYLVRYWEFRDGAPELKAYVDGADFTGIIPHSGALDWYSAGDANAWFRLGHTFTVPSGGATLNFWTNWNTEKNYDYAYVEVHDLNTNQWYTLPGIKTQTGTNVDGYNNPNCPDQFEPETYKAAGRWNAFNGASGGWYQETMSLTPFAGHNIELYFTYWTDPYTLGYGYAVDDIAIPEIGFFDNVESGANGWTFNAGWKMTGGVENDFRVNFIETTNFIKGTDIRTMYHISPVGLNDVSETGQELLKVVNTPTVQTGPAVFVGASQPGYEHSFSTTLDLYVGSPRDLSGPYY
jgi:hypothetical protein